MRSLAIPSLCAAVAFAALAGCSHDAKKPEAAPGAALGPPAGDGAGRPGDPAATATSPQPGASATSGAPSPNGPMGAQPSTTAIQPQSAATSAAAAVPPPAPVLPKMAELLPPPPLPATPAPLSAIEDPKDNPTTPEKVQLGWQLFFDKRLSKDGSMSCESCHHTEQSYTSGQPLDPKVGGAMNKRNAPTMLNVGYHQSFYWDGRKATVEAVSDAAWTGQLGADPAAVAAKLNANPIYRAHFERSFGGEATAKNIPLALAAFLRALKTGGSAWDKFEAGDTKAASKEAQRGFKLFTGNGCALCHAPPLYTDSQFHNTGLGYQNGAFTDHGRMDSTKDAADDGKFKTPTLREIAKTGPYFHDGSGKTLDDAIDTMSGGGIKNPGRDEKLKPHKLSKKDHAAIKAFLESLSGTPTFPQAPPAIVD